LIKDLDKHIGLCLDVGHAQRSRLDPAQDIIQFRDRLHDVDLKDEAKSSNKGMTIECGKGVVDLAKVLRALLKINYTSVVAFEYERDAGDPLPESAAPVTSRDC